MSTQAEKKFVLLQCMEFFRDELEHGADGCYSPRIALQFERLLENCFRALGAPSMAVVDKMKAHRPTRISSNGHWQQWS